MKYDYLLKSCKLCPRECKVNRLEGELGFCGSSYSLKAARASLHFWEEPCLSGEKGSGTVFFSGCNMKCIYCQNYGISHENTGKEISIERLSDIFIELMNKGANNINLVTPTHFIPQIIEAVSMAREKGLALPIVYNSSGYEKAETIKLLSGIIDIYLPDIKYYNDKYSVKYSHAKNYFLYAKEAVSEMVRQVGPPTFDENGLMKSGVIIRHLMLPNLLFDSKKIVDYVYNTFHDSVFLSLMNQYTVTDNVKNSELDKTINPKLYDSLINYALSLGVNNGYIQENGTCSESFIPDFDFRGL